MPTEPGVIEGPTKQGINNVISRQQLSFPNDSPTNITQGDPRVTLVPMVDFTGVNGKSQVPVKGFAEIWLVRLGPHSSIDTTLVQYVSGSQPALSDDAPFFGAFTVVLVQ